MRKALMAKIGTPKIGQAFSGWLSGRTGFARNAVFAAAAGAGLMTVPAAVSAQDLSENTKYSAMVVDAQSGEVFYARRADSARYPASLTKIMTLYVAFDALAQGKLRPDDTIVMSERACSQAPVKVYLHPGQTIDVDTAMRLIALYSANDLAVALAEKIAGSEERFAALMTVKAQDLGMTQTHFVNANGLPDARQLSSARDLAILARAVMRDYPQYYDYFNQESLEYRGHTYVNHNPLHGIPGVDGMKTGFTNAAGYNLVASQVKDGHRLIAVMMGGSNKSQRRESVTEMMNTGFEVIERRMHGEKILIAQNEFANRLDGERADYGYTVLASNSAPAPKPLTDSELRDTLAGSEQANATDDDVQRLSASVKAPALVQALTGTPAAGTPAAATASAVPAGSTAIPYTQLASAEQDTESAPETAAPAPAFNARPAVMKVAMAEHVALAKVESRAEAKSRKTADDDDAPARDNGRGKKDKHRKNPDAVWSIQVGAFKEKSLASNWVKSIQHRFDDALADASTQVSKTHEGWYRTRFASLTKQQAHEACRAMTAKRLDCMVVRPDEG